MTVRPIIFSGPMVQALLAGRKSQTRRLLKDQSLFAGKEEIVKRWPNQKGLGCAPGDMLWVREAFRLRADQDSKPPSQDWWKAGAWYAADGAEPSGCGGGAGKLRSSIHMPRWASRLTLEVTAVKVERLQDISEEDARAEGIERLKSGRGYYDPRFDHGAAHLGYFHTAVGAFDALWTSLHGPKSWTENPWVVAIAFIAHRANVDALLKERAA